MNDIIASSNHRLEKEDIKNYFDIMFKHSKQKKLRLIFNILFIIGGIIYSVGIILMLLAEKNLEFSIIFVSVWIYLLIIYHFIRLPLQKYRFVNKMYESMKNNSDNSDHTDFYTDHLVIHKSKSKIEISYSDIADILETDSIIIIKPNSGLIHVIRKDCFIKNSFDDVRPFIIKKSSV